MGLRRGRPVPLPATDLLRAAPAGPAAALGSDFPEAPAALRAAEPDAQRGPGLPPMDRSAPRPLSASRGPDLPGHPVRPPRAGPDLRRLRVRPDSRRRRSEEHTSEL